MPVENWRVENYGVFCMIVPGVPLYRWYNMLNSAGGEMH